MKMYLIIGLFLLSAISFLTPLESVDATTTVAKPTITTSHNQKEVEARVREYFKDTPVMIEIARCESKFRQFTDSGNVLRGGAGGGMVGVFQFFESIHTKPAAALGFDITTLEGNLGYARHLYTTEGTTPWNSAKVCWDVPLAKNSTEPTREELERQITLLKQIIKLLSELQRLKNQ